MGGRRVGREIRWKIKWHKINSGPTIIHQNPFRIHWLRFLANGGGMDAAAGAAVGDGTRRIDFSLLRVLHCQSWQIVRSSWQPHTSIQPSIVFPHYLSVSSFFCSECKMSICSGPLIGSVAKLPPSAKTAADWGGLQKLFPKKSVAKTPRHISTLAPAGSWYTILG